MSNSSQNVLSLIRSVLTLAGAFLVGHNIFGHPLDSSNAEIIIGSVVSLASIIWGLVDKSTGVDTALSGLRSALLVLGGLGVSWGLISQNTFEAISGFTLSIIPILQSIFSKAKVVQMASGQIVAQKVQSIPGAAPIPNGKTVVAGSPKTIVQKPAA